MIGSIHTNMSGGTLTEKDLEKMLQMAMGMKPVIVPQWKIIMGCRKHIKQLKKRFEISSTSSPVMCTLLGIKVHLYIKPYLKKLYMVDMPKQIL